MNTPFAEPRLWRYIVHSSNTLISAPILCLLRRNSEILFTCTCVITYFGVIASMPFIPRTNILPWSYHVPKSWFNLANPVVLDGVFLTLSLKSNIADDPSLKYRFNSFDDSKNLRRNTLASNLSWTYPRMSSSDESISTMETNENLKQPQGT
ncbi:hypothetical protein B0H16DRAFT_1700709 [Mycena metata]|uniref:Uncharacterized protein n=1 Tax=Mycena metata TaxID=1033252 RepID=A0AAD7HDG6_9AGAR|nr:hypothetical protein B0H16DRAFT_1700709 [Mycena metata]